MVRMIMIIFFTATWCHYCKIMTPIVYKLKTEGYDIQIIDANLNPKLVQKYGITALPTLVVNGTKHEGVRTIDQYRWIMR